MSERYKVVKGSESGHCCFEATVVDTQTHTNGEFDEVCECFNMEIAQEVADALNAAQRKQQEIEP